jgi:hypothetical protein
MRVAEIQMYSHTLLTPKVEYEKERSIMCVYYQSATSLHMLRYGEKKVFFLSSIRFGNTS